MRIFSDLCLIGCGNHQVGKYGANTACLHLFAAESAGNGITIPNIKLVVVIPSGDNAQIQQGFPHLFRPKCKSVRIGEV